MRPLASPWINTFDQVFGSVQTSMIIAVPFFSRFALERIAGVILDFSSVRVEVLTSLNVDDMILGVTDPAALADFADSAGAATIYRLPRLHAKVYVADHRLAVITSSNLTLDGLFRNHEYGALFDDAATVNAVIDDMRQYATLGTSVTSEDLRVLGGVAEELRQLRQQILNNPRETLRREFEARVHRATELLQELRARPGESTNAIFARTILYLLQRGPLTTGELHPLIQSIHPDLCDDSIDRVINGVRFGRRWKHMVRNAQQTVKNRGVIEHGDGRWQLTG